jgi:hypothetical protein
MMRKMGSSFISLLAVFVIPSGAAQGHKRIRGNDWARFWSKVDRTAGPTACWPWIEDQRTAAGYGRFTVRADGKFRDVPAHRWLLGQLRGKPLIGSPRGAEDGCHYCNNPPCCNPLHLYVDSRAGNVKYSVASDRHVQSRKDRCPADHPYDEENTYIRPDGSRACRSCRADQAAEEAERRKKKRTHCKNKHELSGDNLIICKGGRRKCAACEADRVKKSVAGRKRQLARQVSGRGRDS